MSAYLVLILKEVNGLNWVAEYQANVPPLVQKHGGEYVAMSRGFDGQHIQCVEGQESVPDAIAVLRFPTVANAVNLLKSDEYEPYRRMRIAQTKSFAFAFE
jgi:uncharacterized protein (DUF1330 family)